MKHTHACIPSQQPDSIYLSEVSPADAKWDDHKLFNSIVRDLYLSSGWEKYGERADACSGWLQFQNDADGKPKLTRASFCRLRYCPVCQWRRSLMWRARFFKALPGIIEADPKARWIFLTLTVRNCPVTELRETLRKMNDGWQRLSQRKQFPATGFVRATEVTRSEDGTAHPHFHALLQVRPSYFGKGYIKKEGWVRLWRESLRLDYDPVVDVRVVKPQDDPNGEGKGMVGAICETLKYTVKPGDLLWGEEWLTELTKQTHKLRFLATGGTLKQVLGSIEPESDDDMIHVDGEESELPLDAPKFNFGWHDGDKRYRRTMKARTRAVPTESDFTPDDPG